MALQSWVIVLAGGQGERLKTSTECWFGHPYPKQFCAFSGTRSMLEHTLHRAAALVDEERIVTVINKEHTPLLKPDLPGRIVIQPQGKGTGTGILFAASYIRALDDKATVIILPSDHFVFPEESFIDQLRLALSSARSFKDRMILIGAEPSAAEPDYGWVEAQNPIKSRPPNIDAELREVTGFYEKPSPERSREFFRSGDYLWNTMIVATRLETLFQLCGQSAPTLKDRFTKFSNELPRKEVKSTRKSSRQALQLLYHELPVVDFSHHILTTVTDRILIYSLHDAYWSDWGRPERILATIKRFGLTPNFELEGRTVGNLIDSSEREEDQNEQRTALEKAGSL